MNEEDEPHDVPADEAPAPNSKHAPAKAGLAALTLGALGVVFGDIGTSPLYAMKETFSPEHGLKADPTAVFGVLSLIFWAITIVVTCKYVLFILRMDNEGEGGVMALISLIRRARLDTPRATWALVAMGAFGAALFYGDGMITPAISVLSAVEGLEVVAPSMETIVVPATLVILSTLFFVQRFGTGPLGRLFGPIMGAWFGALAIFGLGKVVGDPSVLKALSPTYGVQFFFDHGGEAFLALGSVVLAITGAEALYADMGHFGRGPIRRAWFLLVLPALFLNYLGQGALLLSDAEGDRQPVLPPGARVGADPDGGAGHCGDGDRVAGGDLRRLLGHPPGRAARASSRCSRSATPPSSRSGRSTCRRSTGRCSWRSWSWWSASGPPARSPTPTGSR